MADHGGPYYLLWCLTCDPDVDPEFPTVVFSTQQERGQWAARHRDNAHDRTDPGWKVKTIDDR